MNTRQAKKLRKYVRHMKYSAESELIRSIRDASFGERLKFALQVIFRRFK